MQIVLEAFKSCYAAIRGGELITKLSDRDKEFHFQNWFKARLAPLGEPFDEPGRNTYPDFRMVRQTVGFEIKGLAFPGREKDYDANSQVPSGFHNGREVYYVFGRYPDKPADSKRYPVIDLIMCHGDFLNATTDYVHKNRNVKGFGSYGDIMIRDRKMYVCPAPFALMSGTEGQITLVVPSSTGVTDEFGVVGELTRVEAEKMIVGYEFDLLTNTITSQTQPNPNAGKRHTFKACRLKRELGPSVMLNNPPTLFQDYESN